MTRFCLDGVMQGGRKAALALALALTAVSGGACTDTLKDEFRVVLLTSGQPGQPDPFTGAARINLEVNGRQLSSTEFKGQAFTLAVDDLQGMEPQVTIAVRALDAAGNLQAYGQTPRLDVIQGLSPPVFAFVQRPGTIARAPDAYDRPVTSFVALGGSALPVMAPEGSQLSSLPIFITAMGVERSPTAVKDVTADLYSDDLRVWNPLTFSLETYTMGHYELLPLTDPTSPPGMPTYLPRFRKNAAGFFRASDSNVFIFGGLARAESNVPVDQVTSQLDVLQVRRRNYLDLLTPTQESFSAIAPEVARQSPVLVSHGSGLYAVGGRDKNGVPLKTVVFIAYNAGPPANATLSVGRTPMMSAHGDGTATAVGTGADSAILVFGGDGTDAPGGPGVIAELYRPGGEGSATVTIPAGDPGPARRHHAALTLPDGRVLIVGGESLMGMPLGATVLYQPATKSFAASPLTLATPRSQALAFVVGDDIVVAGGRDGTGAILGNAEIFDAKTLAPAGIVPCLPRVAGGSGVLPEMDMALLMGGQTPDPMNATQLVPTDILEIYQRRRS